MIASAQNFPIGPVGGHDSRRRSGDCERQPRFDAGQGLAIAGAALLAGSLFLPFLFHYRLGDRPSLWQQEMSHAMPLCTVSLLLLAVISIGLAIKRWYLMLWLTGFAAYMALACAVLLSAYLASMTPAPTIGPNLVGGADEPFSFDIGWYTAVLGVVLIFAGAIVDGLLDSRRSAPRRTAVVQCLVRGSEYFWFLNSQRGGNPGEG
jgi:hypothetical protein